eukprot:1396163-Rhodomonas_salina.1
MAAILLPLMAVTLLPSMAAAMPQLMAAAMPPLMATPLLPLMAAALTYKGGGMQAEKISSVLFSLVLFSFFVLRRVFPRFENRMLPLRPESSQVHPQQEKFSNEELAELSAKIDPASDPPPEFKYYPLTK